jgi:hypothetical protein
MYLEESESDSPKNIDENKLHADANSNNGGSFIE